MNEGCSILIIACLLRELTNVAADTVVKSHLLVLVSLLRNETAFSLEVFVAMVTLMINCMNVFESKNNQHNFVNENRRTICIILRTVF